LNLLTHETVRSAVKLVKHGRQVSCGRAIGSGAARPDPNPALHFMFSSGDAAPAQGFGGATDWFGMGFHGHAVTHVDAPSHIFWDGKLYNGFDARRVTTRGAEAGSVELAADGIIGRGVLVDIPRYRGVAKLNGGDPILPDELDACLKSEDVELVPGDILIIRTGRDVPDIAPRTEPAWADAGLHAGCLPWLRKRDIALLVADVAQEVQPSGYPKLRFPVHAVGIVAMGLWFVDNAYLEDLAAACVEYKRWAFLFTVAPLRLTHATGSPVNPIALF
jgi:kynurenine formamidase